MNYQFREKQFGPKFRAEDVAKIKDLIDHSITFSFAAMPGLGVTIFMRYLACQDFAQFIYVDTYALTNLSKYEFYKLLYHELGGIKSVKTEQQAIEQCKVKLGELVKKDKKVVIIFNRFDQLKKLFSNQYFAELISLRNVKPEKIVLIFTATKPYIEILPDDISGDRVNLFSKTFYLKPYSLVDLKKLLLISAQTSVHTPSFIKKAIQLCGGHFQLLQLFLKSERLDPPFIDRYVRFQLKELYEYLNYHQRKQIEQIALGKVVTHIDPYLFEVGMVKKTGETDQLFTPLFTDYVKANLPVKLPIKEKALFNLLKKKINLVVTKDEIFEHIWQGNPDSASDWALNALIYRLKKNPGFISSGFIIENHKKLGYSMIKS